MAAGKKPTHKLCIGEKIGEKTFWTEVGAGWEHAKGISIKVRPGISISGELNIFKVDEPQNT
ncbi:MAG: hypothetical protein COC22_00255 [Flavobacteriaceae bacterium]|nr:MAG: hypothetical protein COC22_00255 [Flavobacteriaceae bacterium]